MVCDFLILLKELKNFLNFIKKFNSFNYIEKFNFLTKFKN